MGCLTVNITRKGEPLRVTVSMVCSVPEGTHQPIRLSGGGVFRLANGAIFRVLKVNKD